MDSEPIDWSAVAGGENLRRNLCPALLVERALARGEARLASNGALAAETGSRTGRSPEDKFTVRDAVTAETVAWGAVNRPFAPERFEALLRRVLDHLRGREIFLQELSAGADSQYRLGVRIVTELAWHSLFVRQLFVRPERARPRDGAGDVGARAEPDFTVISAPGFRAAPERDGTNSEAFVLVDFSRRTVLIGGTRYAGEMKKSIFGVLNSLLPGRDVFPMHCSANLGDDGAAALFFGLSGTGKTTLSTDPTRRLIGDDEHGWSPHGIFNFEGGCYAKCIRLSRENEPQIWDALRFGAMLENVVLDPGTRRPVYDDDSLTENTRAAYPVEHIENAVIPGVGPHPRNVLFLTADAFGVLPPIARLSPDQAMYHFLSGYTAKVAGTEAGMGREPQATFSACFGAPFLPLPPRVYAEMLGRRLEEHGSECWLVNTGWYGGSFGVGKRMSLAHTRAMVRAALDGSLASAEFVTEPAFGLSIPTACPGVPSERLDPRRGWADGDAYDRAAADLAERFARNFEIFEAPEAVRRAGPGRSSADGRRKGSTRV